MKKTHEQLVKQTTPDFTYELLRMRNTWRIKKVGDTILGDLSFRSCAFVISRSYISSMSA